MSGKIIKNLKLYNIFFFLLLFCSNVIFAQNVRVKYEYKYEIDSLNLENTESEIMILDIVNNQSLFISYPKYLYDSLSHTSNSLRTNNISKPFDIDKSKVKDYIIKDYISRKNFLHVNIGSKPYKIPQVEHADWIISNDTKVINGISVQKATTKFLGRNWIAWFSNDYAIQDGPYKFEGLPGLILEIYDDKKYHHFTMLSILNSKKTDYTFYTKSLVKETEVSEEKFSELWSKFLKNPSQNYVSQSSNSNFGMTITFDGKNYSESEILREIEKREKEKYKKINNYLDLELYK